MVRPSPLKIRTSGPPLGPAPAMMSKIPSPFTSCTAIKTPPVKDGAKAKKLSMTSPVWELRIEIAGPPPKPAPAMMSATPSLLKSAEITLIGPLNPGNGIAVPVSAPVTGS